jgi:inositol 1,4,5-triphosphate receptor type 1/inositol 1,4,5-triphosphate receptor type 3
MRGYIKFANKLQSFNYMDVKHFENEVNVKVNICDILDRILDMR